MARTRRWREFVDYTDPQGVVYQFQVPSPVGRWVISETGLGTPPIDYIVQRGTYQDGATVLDFFLMPRVVQLLIRQNFCDREQYWTGRAALLNAIRPNRQSPATAVLPGTLTFYRPDGSKRALDVFLTDGPRFEPRQVGQWDEWAFQEVLRFTAYNPVLYDPGAQSVVFLPDAELVFPITFPIIFGGIGATVSITYPGTWLEYPTITLTGPLESPVVTNETTGEVITLDYDIAAGEVVTINLAYGYKTVTNNSGVNLIGTVTPESDLATWHLAPDPEAAGGVNSVTVQADGTTAGSAVSLAWLNRYFGM